MVSILPCFWCVGICPIPLLQCLQRYKVKDRLLITSVTDVTDAAFRSVLLLLLSLCLMGGFLCCQRWDGKTPQRKDPQLKKKSQWNNYCFHTTVTKTKTSLKQKKSRAAEITLKNNVNISAANINNVTRGRLRVESVSHFRGSWCLTKFQVALRKL